jgi:hypothetical protein
MKSRVKIRCPMCKSEKSVPDGFEFRPFCSSRCKQLDLLNWMEGRYFLPRELTPEEIDQLPAEDKEQVFAQLLERAEAPED